MLYAAVVGDCVWYHQPSHVRQMEQANRARTIQDTIEVPGGDPGLSDVSVYVHITHSPLRELNLSLQHDDTVSIANIQVPCTLVDDIVP